MAEPQTQLEMVQMSTYKLGWLSGAYLNNFYQQYCIGISQEQVFWSFPFLIRYCKSLSAAACKSQPAALLQPE